MYWILIKLVHISETFASLKPLFTTPQFPYNHLSRKCCFFFLLLIGLTQWGYAQDKDCLDKYLHHKDSDLETHIDLKVHYDALDSLLQNCTYEDREWISTVLDKAMELEDSIFTHSFPWKYYVFLYRQQDRDQDAMDLLTRLITYGENQNFRVDGDYYIERGLRYLNEGNFAYELNDYQKGLQAYERDSSKNIFYALSVLGNFYLTLGDTEKAKDYNLKGYKIASTFKDSLARYYSLCTASVSLAEIYELKDSLVKAEYYFNNALKTGKNQTNHNLTLLTYDHLINFYLQNNRDTEALNMINNSEKFIQLSKDSNNWEFKIHYLAYHDLSKSRYGIQNNSQAYIIDPKKISTENMGVRTLKEYYEYAIDYSSYKDQIKRALSYSQELNNLITTEADQQKNSAVDLLTEQQNNVVLQKENILLETSERKKKKQFILLSVLSIFLIKSILLLYYFLKKSNAYNKLIKQKRKNAELQYNELERITYVMTHDLKEPINTVHSFTKLLLARHLEDLDEKGENYLSIISNTTETMLHSVNNIHNYLLLGLKSQLVDCNVEKIWGQAQNNLKAKILKNRCHINNNGLPNVIGHEQDLIILFQSLLSNAIKYSKPYVPPEIKLNYTEQDTHHLFCLKDNGIGMSDLSSDTVFDLFKRLHDKPRVEGSGIGLANARKIIEQHEGEIWVESTLNEGSTFYFTLSKNIKL